MGDKLKVFIYKDSEDRLIATTSMPKLELGGTAVLKVKDVSKIGAFLDMGLEKDLLLPFKEQVYPVRAGEECLVALYIRIFAAMRRTRRTSGPRDASMRSMKIWACSWQWQTAISV